MDMPRPDSNALDRLYADLEADPGLDTFLPLADYYESIADAAAAECLRWATDTHKWPFRYSEGDESLTHHHAFWNEGWYWWVTGRGKESKRWGLPRECELPDALWRAMKHCLPYDPLCFKEYPKVRKAFEALIEAWRK